MKNLLSKNHIHTIIIIVLLGIGLSSCGGLIAKLTFGIQNPKIYSSYTQVDSVIYKQLKREKIHYIVLYNAQEDFFSSFDKRGLFFDNQTQLLVPSKFVGCGFRDTVQIKSTIYKEIPRHAEDTVYLKDVIDKDLVNKDSITFDWSWLHGYRYIVVSDKVTFFSKLERKIIKQIKQTQDINTVLFVFIDKDFYVGNKRAEELQKNENLKFQRISIKREKQKQEN